MGRRYKIRCRECRRRKVKCTAEQPACSRCSENGITCPGYDETKLEFVSYQHRTGLEFAREQLNKDAIATSTSVVAVAKIVPKRENREGEIDIRGLPRFEVLTSLLTPHNAAINLSQVFSTAITTDDQNSALVRQGVPTAAWFFNLPGVALKDPLVEQSLQALSLVHLGKTRGDERAVRMARLSFAEALNLLQVAVRKKRADFTVLTAAVIISFYELYDCPTVKADGWARQVEGAQLSGVIPGPEDLKEVDGVRTWIVFRTLMICNSLCARKRCILAHIKRPQSHIDSNNPIVNLCESLEDISALVGEIVEQADRLTLLPWTADTRGFYTSILDQWRHLNQQFNTWYANLHEMIPSPFSMDETISTEFDFGPSWTFHAPWVTQALLLYWAGKLLLYESLRVVLKWIQNFPLPHTLPPLSPLPTILSPSAQTAHDARITAALSSNLLLALSLVQRCQHDAARNIRKGMRYIWSSDYGMLPQFRAATPLNVATQYLKNIGDEREVRWCGSAKKVFEDNQIALGLFIESCAEEWGNENEGEGMVRRGVLLRELG